jgi:hypothetical protein
MLFCPFRFLADSNNFLYLLINYSGAKLSLFHLDWLSNPAFYATKVRREETQILFLRPNPAEKRRNSLFERRTGRKTMKTGKSKSSSNCFFDTNDAGRRPEGLIYRQEISLRFH